MGKTPEARGTIVLQSVGQNPLSQKLGQNENTEYFLFQMKEQGKTPEE